MSKESSEGRVFESVAELFSLLSTPVRVKIISAVCRSGEMNVSELLAEIETTQPNMSQHLRVLHRAGILGRRRAGTAIYYSLQNEFVAALCRSVCAQIALDLDNNDQRSASVSPRTMTA